MDLWALVVIAALGAYHGLNPAMGWLFAVALGMQDRNRASVVRALPAIAIGHELSLDPDLYVEFHGERPHQVRLQGGDASSDSFCFPDR